MSKQSFIEKHNCVLENNVEYEIFVLPTTNGTIRVIWNDKERTCYSYDEVIDVLVSMNAYSKTVYTKFFSKGVK